MRKVLPLVILTLTVLAAACIPSQEQVDEMLAAVEQTALAQVTFVSPTSSVEEVVQATFQAMTLQAPSATLPAQTTGGISGSITYPAEGIPPLKIAAFQVGSEGYFWIETTQNQTSYQLDNLPPGAYHVMAYPLNGSPVVGAYDQFYLCGMHQGCTDFSLVDIQVRAGVVTPNINIDNWVGGLENYPPMPGGGTDYIPTNTPPGGLSGSIGGTLSYPSEGIPPMVVVAFHVGGSPNDFYYVTIDQNQGTYQIDNLPVGQYYIVAYPMLEGITLKGGYTQAVPCGLSVSCMDHSPIPVTVNAGQVTTGIAPADWYAPPEMFPDNPVP
jgi:hypothetical protein